MRKLVIPILICLDILGFNVLFRFLNRNKAIILWYHGIWDDDGHSPPQWRSRLHLSKSTFKRQVTYLKQKGYSFVTMSELVSKCQNNQKIGKLVALTFDDGYENVVDNAYPIMKELNAKGCLYVVSNYIGTNEALWPDYVAEVIGNIKENTFVFSFKQGRLNYHLKTKKSYEDAIRSINRKLMALSSKERNEHLEQFHNIQDNIVNLVQSPFKIVSSEKIQDLDKRILEIGCHTKDHEHCTKLASSQEFDDQLNASKKDIENFVGYRVFHFCYPFGSYNDQTVEYMRKYGYQSAVTTNPGLISKRFDLLRLKRVGTDENFFIFKATTSGLVVLLLELYNRIRKGKYKHATISK